MKYKARYNYDMYRDSHELLIVKENDSGEIWYAKPFVFKKTERYAPIESFISGPDVKEFMQTICNIAYENGIYPVQLSDKSDELKATKYHLEDFRKLVFKGK